MESIGALSKKLSDYLDPKKVQQVNKAYNFACEAHSGQYRSSGDPYVTHPIAVASILGNFRMDEDSLSAAMLHDVMEDSGIPKSVIEKKFNKDVADLVDGVSKLNSLTISSKNEAQAENLQKMVLAMSKDIRVIVVKLADRLHNMRTLLYLDREKQLRIARETLEIYAPIAPGLISTIMVKNWELFSYDKKFRIDNLIGTIALDGERELEIYKKNILEISLEKSGPFVIDVIRSVKEENLSRIN